MSKETSPQPPRDATDVRFSTQSLLILMAVVAVVTTALGAFIRRFPEDLRLGLVAYWGMLILIIVSLVVYHASKRHVAERKAGRVMFVLPTHSFVIPRMPRLGTTPLATLLVSTGPALWILGSFMIEQRKLAFALFNYNTFMGPAATAVGITMLWWRNVRLAEFGLVVHSKFVPWENATRWFGDARNRNVVVISGKEFKTFAILVPPVDRADVDRLLREKAPSQPASPPITSV